MRSEYGKIQKRISALDSTVVKLTRCRPGHVYILRSDRPFVDQRRRHIWKIGVSRDVEARRTQLERFSWFRGVGRLEVVRSIASDAPFRLETFLHGEFGRYRIRGEWFDLDLAAVRSPDLFAMWLTPCEGQRHDFGIAALLAAAEAERDRLRGEETAAKEQLLGW